jgi:UDP-3-O-[3-hydroxymyristoyl] N-acetylglucosamine deacetylase/3-hydroxyacyl-[acyl-carrier-protein] dehydratase
MTSNRNQNTLAGPAEVRGIGFVTEADVTVRFLPAEPDTGVVFRRVDLPGRPQVAASVRNVVPRQRRTALQAGEASVEMVEHVLAALAGLRVDNCTVEIDAGETPGCDGSSRAFVEALRSAGLARQSRPRPALRIDRPVTVSEGHASLAALPAHDDRFVVSYHLDYAPPIGRQSQSLDVEPDSFEREIAACRTFLLEPEAEAMRAAGMGKRLGPTDLLVFGADGPIDNTLRFPDECVRHKMLDLVGDLALAGCDLVGHVVAHRSGHLLNAALVRSLLESASAEEARTPSTAPPVTPEEPPTLLDVGQIMRILPHRHPFLLVDRVVHVEPGRRIVALKNVTINEPFFEGHWPERPVMPGVLIVEALAQTAGILIARSALDARPTQAVIASIDDVKMRRPVVPGDRLELLVEGRRLGPRVADVQAEARVAGTTAVEAKIRFVITDRERAA